MDWNGFLREKKWKHVKKDQWLILFLAGVLASDHCDACRQEKQYNIGCGDEYAE